MYSKEEKAEVIRRIDEVRDGLMAAISGLSEPQLKFKPSPEAWSIAEIVEHVAIVEDRILGRVTDLFVSTAPDPAVKGEDADGVVFEKAMDRSIRVNAPDFALPKGEPFSTSLERLTALRQRIIDLVQSAPANFREYSSLHPRLGPLDSHQWMIMMAGHCFRHTQQIITTKSAAGFPAQ